MTSLNDNLAKIDLEKKDDLEYMNHIKNDILKSLRAMDDYLAELDRRSKGIVSHSTIPLSDIPDPIRPLDRMILLNYKITELNKDESIHQFIKTTIELCKMHDLDFLRPLGFSQFASLVIVQSEIIKNLASFIVEKLSTPG